jgi:hypothetical protein
MMKYTLDKIYNIASNNFEYVIEDDVLSMINYLAKEVGSNSIITNNLFKSKEIVPNVNSNENKYSNKKKKTNKSSEISSEEWESLRNFQATKIEKSNDEIDQIRLHLNKLTDKTYNNMKEHIIKNIENILLCDNKENYYEQISNIVFSICSNNKFYSKIYANLYKELCEKYSWLTEEFENNFHNFTSIFKNTEYVEPNENYDRYCELTKIAETRKSKSLFFLNLAKNGFIKPLSIYTLLRELIVLLLERINIDNQNNAVDDIVENIALLFDKDIIREVEDDDDNDIQGFQLEHNGTLHEENIIELIDLLSGYKSSDFKSLTNKSIFKFMDLVD